MARCRRESLPRTGALIVLGALALHHLRYLAATDGHPGAALAAQGHGYMSDAVPALAAFVLASLAAGLLRAFAGRDPGRAPALLARTFGFALALFAVFTVQESLEGALAAGHPSGLAAVLAGGGWLAVPLAAILGALCALCERRMVGLERFVAVAFRARRSRRLRPRFRAASPLTSGLAPAPSPLAFGAAIRPPPLPLLGS